ncbi:MAG: hypothetical protein JWN56_343 [Sphingobacteriales bacterium]|nr:hypothetical protein [Sphingobacteriales bacterium]
MKYFYNSHANLLRATLLILLVTLFAECKKDVIETQETINSNNGLYSTKQLKREMLLSVEGVTNKSFYLEDALPKGYVIDGSKDYTSIIQSVLDRYSDIVFPDFPLLVNDKGLIIGSNKSIVFLEGSEIRLKPTKLHTYDILKIEGGKNITLYNPVVIGDRYSHLSEGGEHGIGIGIRGATDITVLNPNVRECWGDGIYIGQMNNTGSCKNIVIKNAYLKRNRRDGISIISVNGLRLESPYLGYSDGVEPMCGINFEANNPDCVMKDVLISDPHTFKNLGNGIQMGFRRMLGKGNRSVDITITNHVDVQSGRVALKTACTNLEGDENGTMSGTVRLTNPTWKSTASGFPLYYSTNQSNLNLVIENPTVVNIGGSVISDDIAMGLFKRGIVGVGKLKVSGR